jgi:hypothetical protein
MEFRAAAVSIVCALVLSQYSLAWAQLFSGTVYFLFGLSVAELAFLFS